jgi:dihydroneopterin aldolase/2-amino-4-hydroxy-6-hydroxymethyldihydropteridine diphosphokinase
MTRAFVSIGSNIDPEENVKKAVLLLAGRTTVRAVSTVYLTAAEDRPEQPPYYNCVVEIETELPAIEVKHRILRRIEAELGRMRTKDRYAARTIDLDLILYDELVTKTDDLTLPDPDITGRPYLAVPLQELEPGLTMPGSGMPIHEVAAALSRKAMKPLEGYTELLRKELSHERKQ